MSAAEIIAEIPKLTREEQREIIRLCFEQWEDEEDEKMALEALEDIRNGAETIPFEQIRRELGL